MWGGQCEPHSHTRQDFHGLPPPPAGNHHLRFCSANGQLGPSHQESSPQSEPWKRFYIPHSHRFFRRPSLSLGLWGLFAQINMFMQFFTHEAGRRAQTKADTSPSGHELAEGSSGRKIRWQVNGSVPTLMCLFH